MADLARIRKELIECGKADGSGIHAAPVDGDLTHLRGVVFKEHADRLIVDPLTLKHLEIVEAMDGGRAGSLLNELDRTMTPMGARLLRTWLIRPLLSLERTSSVSSIRSTNAPALRRA